MGAFSYIFANRFKKVLAIDANSDVVEIAKELIGKKQINHVEFFIAGLCKAPTKEVVLYHSINSAGTYASQDSSTIEWDKDSVFENEFPFRQSAAGRAVPGMNWADLMRLADGTPISLAKIDIEGAEYDLLIDQDLDDISNLIIEIHYTTLGRTRTQELIDHLYSQMTPIPFLSPKSPRCLAGRPHNFST